jgi:hypothetical protein
MDRLEAGTRGRLLALPLVPEIFYDLFLEAVYVKGVLDISFGRTANWRHLRHPEARASQAVGR